MSEFALLVLCLVVVITYDAHLREAADLHSLAVLSPGA